MLVPFEQTEIDRIRNKTDEEKLLELCDFPQTFCVDMIYLIDYHLTTDLKTEMYLHLNNLKQYILLEQDSYVFEQITLLLQGLIFSEEIVYPEVV